MAHRKAIDHVRSRRRAPVLAGNVPETADTRASSPGEPDEGLWSLVRELPTKQRTALALRYVADAGYDEISAVMGTSEDAARRNVHESTEKTANGVPAMSISIRSNARSGGPRRLPPRLPDLTDAAAAAGLLDVAYATLDSPLGTLLLAATPQGLVRLAYVDFEDGGEVLEELATKVSPRVLAAPRRLDDPRRELDQYFAGRRREFDLPLDWQLTRGFARRVLEATSRIPYGGTATYK